MFERISNNEGGVFILNNQIRMTPKIQDFLRKTLNIEDFEFS